MLYFVKNFLVSGVKNKEIYANLYYKALLWYNSYLEY